MTGPTLVVATPDDWGAWRALRLTALREAPSAFGSTLAEWRDAGEDRWRQRLSIPGSLNVLAELDGTAVGMVSGVPGEAPGQFELISMYVASAARGTGLGERLVEAVREWSVAAGGQRLSLMVYADNAPAIALYRRCGFEPSGREEVDGARPEIEMTVALP